MTDADTILLKLDRLEAENASLRTAVERLESGTRRRPTAFVLAILLALALFGTGTAFAAATIGTADLKDAAVTNPKIAATAVSRGKIANGAVGGNKLAGFTKKSVTSIQFLQPGKTARASAECPSGGVVISSSYTQSGGPVIVSTSTTRTGVSFSFYNPTTSSASVTPSINCLM
jgi:hypothetical protein